MFIQYSPNSSQTLRIPHKLSFLNLQLLSTLSPEMSAQQLSSILSGLSAEDISIIDMLLKARQQTTLPKAKPRFVVSDGSDSELSLADDYTSDDEEESAPKITKPRRGRPKKIRTPEEEEAIEAKKSAGKSRGRPKKIRTEEEIAEMKAKIEAKEQRRIEREIKDAMKSDEAVAKQHRIKMRKEAATVKKAEQAEKALALKAKRTEIYGKMLTDAAAYKAKWGL